MAGRVRISRTAVGNEAPTRYTRIGTEPEARPTLVAQNSTSGLTPDRAEQIARDRIEKRAVEIAVRAARDDDLVGALDLDPQRHIGAPRLQLLGDGRHRPRDAQLVQLDAGYRIELGGMPILGEEIQGRAPRDPAELFVIEAEVLGDQCRVILRGDPFLYRGGAHERCGPVRLGRRG